MNVFSPKNYFVLTEIQALLEATNQSKVKFDLVYDLNLILGEPYKICFVEHWMHDPEQNIKDWSEEYQNLDFSIFDLVIIVDPFCCDNNELIQSFVQQNRIKNYLLITADNVSTIDTAIHYPHYLFQVLNWNEFKESNHYLDKPFLFDALLGSPKAHRSYVMKRFQENEALMSQSVVSYQDIYRPADINAMLWHESCADFSWLTQQHIPPLDTIRADEIWYPYVSTGYQLIEKYDPLNYSYSGEIEKQQAIASLKESINNVFRWADNHGYNIEKNELTQLTDLVVTKVIASQLDKETLIPEDSFFMIPWRIYANTWYSIITETNNGDKDGVSLTEKIGRAFFAKRIFILVGAAGSLALLKKLGFRTFDTVIDESYDEIKDNYCRWTAAFDQVEKLAELDPRKIYDLTEEIREHNFNRLREYYLETQNKVQNRLWLHIAYGQHAIRMMHALNNNA